MARKRKKASKRTQRPGFILLGAGLAMGLADRSAKLVDKHYKRAMKKK